MISRRRVNADVGVSTCFAYGERSMMKLSSDSVVPWPYNARDDDGHVLTAVQHTPADAIVLVNSMRIHLTTHLWIVVGLLLQLLAEVVQGLQAPTQ